MQNLASQCAVCHSWPARRVCIPCVARFGQATARCITCALALPADLSMGRGSPSPQCATCIRRPPPLDACFAAVGYVYPWSMLLADYKFGQDSAWAGELAALLGKAPGVIPTLTSLASHDLIIPMPLSPERLASRGFNQAWELAKALAAQSRSPARAEARLLLRIKNTLPQAQLKREARLQNVKGAFVVDPLRAREIANRRVVLIDDVMTSGASLFTAAQALREAGAAHVTGLVFARTEG